MTEKKEKVEELEFTCPNDGKISRDSVAFLCNVCGEGEVIFRNGLFVCPQCLKDGENFQCMLCDSKDVKAVIKGQTHQHL